MSGAIPQRIPDEAAATCANCGAALAGPWCASCGQKADGHGLSLAHLFHEFVHDYLHLDGKLPRTSWLLFRRPGLLSREWVEGRRARYVGPFKLYLVASLALFGAWSLAASSLEAADPADASRQGSPAVTISVDHAPGFVSRAAERFKALGREQALRHVREVVHADAPKLFFVLLPLAALLLELVERKRYYVEHFVFVLHLHTAAFVVLALAALVRALPLAMVVPVYAYFGMRRFYGWSRAGTIARMGAVGVVYTALLGIGLFSLTVIAVLVA